jgi:hypothetical protein
MEARRLIVDAARTTLEIRTFAEGALSGLAHDLSLIAAGVSGSATAGDNPEADLLVSVGGIHVRGVLRNGAVDPGSPSRIERHEIEKRIRQDVLPGTDAVSVQLRVRGTQAEARVQWARGSTTVSFSMVLEKAGDTEWHTRGSTALSLAALGVKPIYGPLRAFRVADRIEVHWDAVARAA